MDEVTGIKCISRICRGGAGFYASFCYGGGISDYSVRAKSNKIEACPLVSSGVYQFSHNFG